MNREFRWNQESFQRISKSSVYNYNHLGERKLRPSCSNICNAWFAHFKWKEQIGKGLCTQWCLTLCNPMDCSPPHSSVHGILQARIVDWVAMPSSWGSSWSRDWTCISYIYPHWQVGSLPLAPPGKPLYIWQYFQIMPRIWRKEYENEGRCARKLLL